MNDIANISLLENLALDKLIPVTDEEGNILFFTLKRKKENRENISFTSNSFTNQSQTNNFNIFISSNSFTPNKIEKKIDKSIKNISSFKIRYLNYKRTDYSETYLYTIDNKIDIYIIPSFNNLTENLFSLNFVERFRKLVQLKDYETKYKNSVLYILKDMINYARKINIINSEERDNLIEFVKPFKEVKINYYKPIRNRYTSYKDFLKLITNIDDYNDKVLFRLLYFSGLRIGEFLGVQIKDIRFKKNIAYVHIYKQKLSMNGTITKRLKNLSSYKVIIYTHENCEILKEYISRNILKGEDFLFDTYRVKIQRKLDRYLKKAKLKHNSLHGFGRKSINTELYKIGADSKVRATLLGQTSTQINEQNYIDKEVALKKAIRFLDDIPNQI